MGSVFQSDYIVGTLIVRGEELLAVTNSYTGAFMDIENLEKLQKDITRLLELVSADELNKYNEERTKKTYEEWVALNQGPPKYTSGEKVDRPINKPGFVYLIKEYFSGTYKIGMTTRIKERQSTFGVTLPFEWEFIKIYKTTNRFRLEELLHKKFSERRVKGEWFELSEEEVRFFSEDILSDPEISDLIAEVVPCPTKN